MKKQHPFLLLFAFLLGLGVMAAVVAPCCASKSTAPLCQTEEERAGECLDELPEEQFDFIDDFIIPEWCIVRVEHPLDTLLVPSELRSISSIHCPFGWRLPLRI